MEESTLQHWTTLPEQLLLLPSKWLQDHHYAELSLAEAQIRAEEELRNWTGLVPLIEQMREYPALLSLYPSAKNALLRLSKEPLRKDSPITYDLRPTFPIWCEYQSPGNFLASWYTYDENRHSWQNSPLMDGDPITIARFVSEEVEKSDFRNSD